MSNCSPSLFRVRQLLASKESVCDAPAYILSGQTALEVQVSPAVNIKNNMVENNVAKACLTPTPSIPSTTDAEAVFSAYLKGSGSVSVEPAVGIYLEGCGLVKKSIKKATYSTITGSVTVGDLATASGKSAIIRFIDTKAKIVYLEVLTGTLASADVLVVSSGNSITLSSSGSNSGFAYVPSSSGFDSLTLKSEEGEVLYKEIFGALGTLAISSDSSNPAKCDFTFTGRVGKYLKVETSDPISTWVKDSVITWTGGAGIILLDYSASSPYLLYTLTSGVPISNGLTITQGVNTIIASGDSFKTIDSLSTMTNVNYEQTIPPILQCSDVHFGSLVPVVQNVSFTLANTVSMRKNFNSCDGYSPAFISARKPTLKVNPEVMSPEEYDMYSEWTKGSIVDGISVRWGDTVGNTIILYVDKIQWQSITDGDRDGIAILDAEALVTSDKCDNEFCLLFI